MINRLLLLLMLFAAGLIACSPETKQYQITGVISNPEEKTIVIGGQIIPISEDGKFSFTKEIERPIFLDISYAQVDWTVFLEPGKNLQIQISEPKLKAIEYKGDLVSTNTYLLGVNSISSEINDFLNQNWVQIHQQNQEEYISTIDSLKRRLMEDLRADPERYQSFPKAFVKAWKTDLDFALNKIMLYYPKNHFYYTGKKVELSDESLSYIKVPEIDTMSYFDLPNYKDYAEDWLDYQSEQLVKREPPVKHYNLMKMDAVSRLIPEIFTSQYFRDYWYAEYLKEHIENNGLSNSQPYIKEFEEACKTDIITTEMQNYLAAVRDSRADHEVEIFKTDNSFILEAHIFYPNKTLALERHPAIIIFHGGGWNSGNPSWAFERAKHFRDLGLVAIAAQYRLTNLHDITAIESMSDARALIMWMRQNATSTNIDPDRIAAYGWSAGAHLVSSAAIFSESIPGNTINSIPNAMILVSPAVSLPKGKGWEGWKFNVFGANTTVSSANPLEHVRSGLQPTIILQGRDDTVTPLEGIQAFHDQMMAHGNHCELFIYDGVGHLFTPNTMPDNREPHPDKKVQGKAYDQADAFLKNLGYI
jgi:acetyl esterase